ncbi:hypothetical protein [Neisseria sp. S1]|uniref:hypothetical protein n=1 Tax=Neisseria sp. S1 TaxID=3318354 RepID=UPI003A8AB09E
MTKIIFSQTNIESLIAKKQLNITDLLEQFERSDLVSTARYRDSSGLPWGSWKNVVTALDAFLLEQNWVFKPNKLLIFNVNVAYFAPSSFIKAQPEDILNILQNCTQTQLNFVFTQPIIVNYFLKLLIQQGNHILERITDKLLLSFLQALTQNKNVSSTEEIQICQNFLKIHNLDHRSISRIFLEARIKSLQKISTTLPKTSKLKVALLICGQLRGFEYTLPRFAKKFAHLGLIDAYVSTWEEVGYTRFNLQNTYRIFDKPTCDFIIENKDALDLSKFDEEIYRYTAQIYSPERIQEILNNQLSWCNNLKINLKNHQEYPYNKMSNAEKMYYHNSYWIETLNEDYFKQYDLIIKIRPDYFFKDDAPISVKDLSSKNLLTDTPNYLFQEWGFGLGDQLWIGMPEPMLSLLSCHKRDSISYEYMYTFYKQEPYQGHLNCGFQAWLSGLSIVENNAALLKSRLASIRLINFAEFQQMNVHI